MKLGFVQRVALQKDSPHEDSRVVSKLPRETWICREYSFAENEKYCLHVDNYIKGSSVKLGFVESTASQKMRNTVFTRTVVSEVPP